MNWIVDVIFVIAIGFAYYSIGMYYKRLLKVEKSLHDLRNVEASFNEIRKIYMRDRQERQDILGVFQQLQDDKYLPKVRRLEELERIVIDRGKRDRKERKEIMTRVCELERITHVDLEEELKDMKNDPIATAPNKA